MQQMELEQKANEPKKPQRLRWLKPFRFGLRTIFLLMLTVAVSLGWWLHTGRRQKADVAAIQSIGGISYDFQEYGLEKPHYWPAWIVDEVGVDQFARVKMFFIQHSEYSRSYSLEEQDLQDIQTTLAGLVRLRNFTALEYLDLSSKFVTDEGMIHIKHLTKTQQLYLNDSKITDEGLSQLNNLTALKLLDLGNTQITDEGLTHLKYLTALQQLNLHRTQVTDQGLAHLKQFKTLEILSIDGSQLSDESLAHLKCLPALKELHLRKAVATDEVVAWLNKELPNCQVHDSLD